MMKRLMRSIRRIVRIIRYTASAWAMKLNGKDKISREYLKSIKDKYKDQRCFIIGNGPSLTKEDLEKLTGEITFASNRIYNIFSETDWRPTYHCILDEGVAASEGVIDGINSFECEMKFVRMEGYYIYRKIKAPICFIHSWHSRKYLKAPQFSTDLSEGVYTIATVTYTLIQLAVYMGFKEIYLIGVDNKYANTKLKDGTVIHNTEVKSYFGDQRKAEKLLGAAATWEMDIAYEYAEKYSRNHDFRIYNATRGGYLEAFERVDFDSLF